MKNMIEVKNLKKSYGNLEVIKGIDLTINESEIVSIIGGSGCGKSVLLRNILMLDKPDEGSIFINGEEITKKGANINKIRRNIGMVYQDFGLFSNMNVMDNLIIAPVKILKMKKDDATKKAFDLLSMVGMKEKAYSDIVSLSGGQKQRIAICRCMMMDPKIIFFDEPTSALDPTMVGEVLATIRFLAKRGLTMAIVTHEMNFAKSISDRVLFLADGTIYEEGNPKEIFENPKKEKTIKFINRIKNLNYKIESKNFDLMNLQGEIQTFSYKYGLSNLESYRLQICVEEIVYELFNGCYKESDDINIIIDIMYSENTKTCSISFKYNGKRFNPLEISDSSDDKLAHLGITIIKSKSKIYNFNSIESLNEINIEI